MGRVPLGSGRPHQPRLADYCYRVPAPALGAPALPVVEHFRGPGHDSDVPRGRLVAHTSVTPKGSMNQEPVLIAGETGEDDVVELMGRCHACCRNNAEFAVPEEQASRGPTILQGARGRCRLPGTFGAVFTGAALKCNLALITGSASYSATFQLHNRIY